MATFIKLFILLSAIWVLVDAKHIGVKKGLIKGIWGMGPWGWFFTCLLLWIIGFPMYLIKRSEFKNLLSKKDGKIQTNNKQKNSIEDLEKFANLRDKGIITEEEFQSKKIEILS